MPLPVAFYPCAGAADLFFKWESAWGNRPILGTEPLAIQVFNRGYDLAAIRLLIRLHDQSGAGAGTGRCMVELDRSIDALGRGKTTTVELHSFELARPVGGVEVELISAEFDRSGR